MHGSNWWNGSGPHLKGAYAQLTDGSKEAGAIYRSTLQGTLDDDGAVPGPAWQLTETGRPEDLRQLSVDELTERYVQAFALHAARNWNEESPS